MDLGPHAAFIWAAYAAEGFILALLIGWLAYDGRRQKQRLADLEARGITRRSASRGPAPSGRATP